MIKQSKATRQAKPKVQRQLSEAAINRIVNKMPGGLHGYCIGWGWLTFARAIERAHKIKP